MLPGDRSKEAGMDMHRRGQHEYQALMGEPADAALGELRRRSPTMFDAIIESAFAGPLARAELARSDRELATVAILASSGGAESQLAAHARAALHNGVAASELIALCDHVALYAGFPRAVNASKVVDQVLADST